MSRPTIGRTLCGLLAPCALALGLAAPAMGQTVAFGGSYSQNFNTLPSAGTQTLAG